MPYAAEHKNRTRERIVESARDLFNRKGFVDVSIDEIMSRAGLTRGGFYGHFDSKEDLFVEVVRAYEAFDPSTRWHDIAFDARAPANAFARQMVDAYLSRSHLDDVAGHCPMIALPSDVAHGTERVKQAYRALVERMAGVFAAGLADDAADARQRGFALTALCVGGMVLARTFDDESFRETIRASTHALAAEIVDAAADG